ncbi:hypothetical protein JCM16814_04840 [Desulfobaculum senezii]
MRTGIQKGFSLIEMAIIVVIIGVIVSTALPGLISKIGSDKVVDSRNLVRQARDEIIGEMFSSGSYALPSPGTGNTVPSTIATQTDAWGQPLYYFVADVSGASKLTNSGPCGTNSTQLTVTEPDSSTVSDVAFIVASFGPNSQQDFTALPGSGSATLSILTHGDLSAVDTSRTFDDIFEYARLTYLQNTVDCSTAEHTGPGGSDVSFEDDLGDFPLASPGDGYVTRSGSRTPFTVNADGDGINLNDTGPEDMACIWYMGNATEGACDEGVCSFGSGVRVYFLWSIDTSNGGHTFALCGINASTGLNNDPSQLCGADQGRYLGYASKRPGTSLGIFPPKIGLEFDTREHSAQNDPNDSGTLQAANHMAILYWNTNSTNLNDDTTHIETLSDGTGNPVPGTDGIYEEDSGFWMEKTAAKEIPLRMEVDWNATTKDVDIRIWHNCTNADCGDLAQDLDQFSSYDPIADAPTITDSRNLGIGDNEFQHFRFGWTYSSRAQNYNATITDFRIRFKD